MKNILQMGKGDDVLRGISKEIPVEDITSPKIKKIIKEMSEALDSQDDGVALAAPQIGYLLSIFVVSGKVFDKDFLEERTERISGNGKKKASKKKKNLKNMVFINPKISKLSKDKEWVPEGCLSMRWLYGQTKRSKKATVTAYDETGKKFTRGASRLLAQIFQHETDHLKGVLFTDHAKDVVDEPPVVQSEDEED